MELKDVLATAVTPALALLPDSMNSAKARVMLLAIGLQESRFEHTHQIGGPAHSWWQFEQGSEKSRGGVWGVLNHHSTMTIASTLCAQRGITGADARAVHDAMEHDQVLAAGMARLLLWTDPRPLPKIGDNGAAWDLYLRTWRPGKPKPQTWGKLYDQASFAVMRAQQVAA
ncbi:endolysin [Achromobacter phage Mano]|uniref:Endolysin n=1 Tax=Achromobacter phage Mano TaxID=2767570 RepID=A0A7L8G6L0_9CAUD|nr:endolysin [Achromobacter phage Mano]QOE32795.1 endolysin [Achromobacter phage Mano]